MMAAVVVVDAAVITVRGHQVRDCLRRARMRPIYVHGRDAQGWVLDRRRLGDAVAALERGGYDVRLEGETTSTTPTSWSSSCTDDLRLDEDGLW
jgi:hypothetical protein